MTRKNRDVGLASLLLATSGAAALGHQVLWTRRMIDLLGASAESNARVFECFFLGLALGAATVSLVMPKVRRPWRLLTFVELGVATLSLPALLLPFWATWLWPSLGAEALVGSTGTFVKLGLSILVVLPPAFLMGTTLPLMIATIPAGTANLPRQEINLYAANTLGGVFGLGLVVLVVLRIGGVGVGMVLMMALNLTVATTCYLKSRGESSTAVDATSGRGPGADASPDLTSRMSLLISFASGAGVVALEVLSLAMVNLKAPLAIYPQAVILLVVIAVLALSAWIVPRLVPLLGTPEALLPGFLAATGVAVALVPVFFMSLPGSDLGYLGYGHGFANFLKSLTVAMCTSLGPAILIAGTILPMVVGWHGGKGETLPGRMLARLLAVNGLGGVLGAEISYRFLLPQFGAHVSIGVVGVAYVISAVPLLLASGARRASRAAFVACALIGTYWITKSLLLPLPLFLATDQFKVLRVRSGREGTLATVYNDNVGKALIFDNQYMLGSSKAGPDMRRQAHVPLLLHKSPAHVAFIGLGTGITASGALAHKAVTSITAVELSRLVADAAKDEFSDLNQGICQQPSAHVYVEDARTYLTASRGQFDAVIGDLFTPWRPGEASLCSLEEFEAAKLSLRPGGVFCQWIQTTQWTPEQFDIAAATFRRVFDHLYLFRNHFRLGSAPLGLLGFKDGQIDWGTVAERCAFERDQGQLNDPICRHPEGVAMLYLGEYVPEETRISTLNNIRLELSAARQLVAENPENYLAPDGQVWLTFTQNRAAVAQLEQTMPDYLRALPQAGLLASQLEIARRDNAAAAVTLEHQLLSQLPRALTNDTSASWTLWPGSRSPLSSP